MAWLERFRRGTATEPVAAVDVLPRDALALLAGLDDDWALVGPDGVVRSSRRFDSLGVTRGRQLASAELELLLAATRSDGQTRSRDIAIGGIAMGVPPGRVRARCCMVDDEQALLLLEDISAASRVDAMRRDFIVTVSEELRAPVANMLDAARAMAKAVRKGRDITELASAMEADAMQLSGLVGDVTALSRLQASDIMDAAHSVDVADLAVEAVDAMTDLARSRGITLLRDVPHLRLVANGEQVVSALCNLIENGIRYSGPHTAVRVTARTSDGYVEIAVADEGIGIPPEHLGRIFERFHRVNTGSGSGTRGTGLGLTIVQHICEAHGGEVTVESTVGEGSVFTLRLPSRTPATASSAQEA